MWKLPLGYTVYKIANNGNQVTAQKGTSTPSKVKMIIIDRVDPIYNQATQSYSVPEYRVRVLFGTVDAQGAPRPERLLADLNFRTPIGSSDDQAEWFGDVAAVIGAEDFLSTGIQQHNLPTCCTEEGDE